MGKGVHSHVDAVRLQRLTVDNDMVTDAGIRAVLDALPIGYLSAAFCYQLTGEAVEGR